VTPRDPVRLLTRRHRALCLDAAGPLEIAAGLEAAGLTDRAAAPYRHPDVFSLAEELHARVPPTGAPAADADPWAVLDLGAPLTARVAALRARARAAVLRWAAPLTFATVAAAVPPGPLGSALLVTAGVATARTLTQGPAARVSGPATAAPPAHAGAFGRSRLARPAPPAAGAGPRPRLRPGSGAARPEATGSGASGLSRLARAVSGGRGDGAAARSGATAALGRLARLAGRARLAPTAFALVWALAPLCAGSDADGTNAAGAALVWAAPVGAGVAAWVWRRAVRVLAGARTVRGYGTGVRPAGVAAVAGFAAAQAAVGWAAGPGWVVVAAGAGLFAAGLLPPGPGAVGALGLGAALAARAGWPSPLLTAVCAVAAAVLAAYAVGVLSRAAVCAAALDLSSSDASDVPTRSKP
jgi:hypothetical protein